MEPEKNKEKEDVENKPDNGQKEKEVDQKEKKERLENYLKKLSQPKDRFQKLKTL